jgi:hypothetical protein
VANFLKFNLQKVAKILKLSLQKVANSSKFSLQKVAKILTIYKKYDNIFLKENKKYAKII